MSKSELEKLPNLGAVIVGKLEEVGIRTPEQLRQIGAEQAWLRIRQQVDPGECLSSLQALEGAVRGVRWHFLPQEVKDQLKDFYRQEAGK